MLKWIVIVIALAGLAMGIWTVSTAGQEPAAPPPAQPPSVNPFADGVAASGVVEAASRNVTISAPESGLVVEVSVQVGESVKKGDPLFQLDPRALRAELVRFEAARAVAAAELERLEKMPRPEDIPPLTAAVDEAQARVDDASDELERMTKIMEKNAATEWEMRHQQYLLAASRAALEQARARLALTQAGAWEPEKAVSRARLAAAEADAESIRIRLDRLTVRSPIDGTVLKRDIEPGQWAAATVLDPSMVIGDLSTMHVRAQVDEEDAPRLRRGAAGVARIRGPLDVQATLSMIRIEPLARPKSQITGATIERVDTRVIDVLFKVEGTPGATLYPGQVVDVYIDAAGAK